MLGAFHLLSLGIGLSYRWGGRAVGQLPRPGSHAGRRSLRRLPAFAVTNLLSSPGSLSLVRTLTSGASAPFIPSWLLSAATKGLLKAAESI